MTKFNEKLVKYEKEMSVFREAEADKKKSSKISIRQIDDKTLRQMLISRIKDGGTKNNSPTDEILDADPDFDWPEAMKQWRVQHLFLSIPDFPQDYFKQMFKRRSYSVYDGWGGEEEYDMEGEILDLALQKHPKEAADTLLRWPRFKRAALKWAQEPETQKDYLEY